MTIQRIPTRWMRWNALEAIILEQFNKEVHHQQDEIMRAMRLGVLAVLSI